MKLLALAQQAGLNPKYTSSTAGGEFHSSCPACGGRDRFYIQPHKPRTNCIGYYACRQCGIYGDTIQFAMDFNSMTFPEAVDALGAKIPQKSSLLYHVTSQAKNAFTPAKIEQPGKLWQKNARVLVASAHKQIWDQQHAIDFLHKRGLSDDTISKYKIGWCPQDIWHEKSDWGIISHDKVNANLWIPRGIVIPSCEPDGTIQRIKVRRASWYAGDSEAKYIAISGSMNGLCIVGDPKHSVMIVVESELDGYATHHATEDFAFVIAVGSNTKNPDNLTDYYAQKTPCLFICHDNDDAGNTMLLKWQKLYSHAKACPTPYGKDIGEAVEQGLNIRLWVLSILIKEQGWKEQDQELIKWVLQHINTQSASVKSGSFYSKLEAKIIAGTDKTHAFIEHLRHIKQLILQGAQ